MEIKNLTNCEKAENFLKEKMRNYDTERLIVTMKKNSKDINEGFCRYPRKLTNGKRGGYRIDLKNGIFRIVARISEIGFYPYPPIEIPIGSEQLGDGLWKYLCDKEQIDNEEQNMVWILGHEIWHYLCKTKQEKGNYQTKANANGFKWLREFKSKKEIIK